MRRSERSVLTPLLVAALLIAQAVAAAISLGLVVTVKEIPLTLPAGGTAMTTVHWLIITAILAIVFAVIVLAPVRGAAWIGRHAADTHETDETL